MRNKKLGTFNNQTREFIEFKAGVDTNTNKIILISDYGYVYSTDIINNTISAEKDVAEYILSLNTNYDTVTIWDSDSVYGRKISRSLI